MGARVGGGRRVSWDALLVWLLIGLFVAGFWVGVVFGVLAVAR